VYPQRPPETHPLSEDAACKPVKARDLAAAAGKHDLLAGKVIEARRVEPSADLLENLPDLLDLPATLRLAGIGLDQLAPAAVGRVEQLGVYCRFQCALPERQRELAICTVAAHWRADYEWYAHAGLAQKQGISQGVLDAIAAGGAPELTEPADAAVYAFARELLKTGRVSDESYRAVVGLFGEGGAVDLSGLLGYYTLLAMTLNAFEVDVPDEAEIPWASGPRA